MNRVKGSRVFPILSAIGICASAHAAVPATERNFVACPIVLDTQDVPCWVAEYQGERYFLAVQTGRSAGVTFVPQLKHRVLVEGTAHPDQPRICGGIVLSPVKLSVFPDVEPGCGKMLPGDGYTVKSPRPIGPDGVSGERGLAGLSHVAADVVQDALLGFCHGQSSIQRIQQAGCLVHAAYEVAHLFQGPVAWLDH